jgi:ATP-dependent exoDNAse (exonuclease V) beta subunit
MALRLADAGRPSLRDFVLWARHQVERDVRARDVASNEQSDVVRVITVHAAKGLEFPIVILTGLNSGKRNDTEKVIFDHSNGVASSIGVGWGPKGARFETGGFKALQDQEKNAEELETVRLMYVAATRAKDHLIVSTYRKDEKKSSSAKVFAELSGDVPQMWSPVIPIPEPPGAGGSVAEPTHEVVMLDNPDAWERERDALIRQMSDSQIISASSLHDSADSVEDAKIRDEQIESDPWRRGRAATSIGRAVHAVLQDIDLTNPSIAELGVLAAKHSSAHAVAGFEDEIFRLAQATLEAPVMRRAAEALAKGRAWRESYVSAPVGDSGLILEGYVDLVFEDDEGALVIVDYKTDRTTNAAKAYELQLGAYVAAVRKATGLAVSEAVLVFSQQASEALKNGSSLEDAQHSVSDLDQAADLAVKRAEEKASAE